MSNKTDKSFVLIICLLVSISSTVYFNYFGYANAERLFSFDDFDLAFSKRAIWLMLGLAWLNYSALAIGLVVSIYSQVENNFSDLSRKYLAYLIYIVCIINLVLFTWNNWIPG